MDIAKHLAVIDELCAREFPTGYGRVDVGTGGPGYFIAELATSGDFYEAGLDALEETEAQFDADRDALGERLGERWAPVGPISLFSAFQRSEEGEAISEPWRTLASHVPDLHLWKSTQTGRWIALGVSQWDRDLPFQLLAVVTDVDLP
ncbi:hypothetical protein ACFV2H_31525 [Streptomyces sp. NPDC059629]|uniref:hypothetical protein n=1 Tax=Streptomyces sp. NPDC059629 TaxID=3346889 RepID=UPI003690E772